MLTRQNKWPQEQEVNRANSRRQCRETNEPNLWHQAWFQMSHLTSAFEQVNFEPLFPSKKEDNNVYFKELF